MNEIQQSGAELVAELSRGLQLAAMRMLGDLDDAHDAVQETTIRLLAILSGSGIPAGYTLSTYAYGILKHVVADMQRRHKRLTLLPAWLSARGSNPLDELADRQQTELLRAALSKLEPADRRLLERCYLNGERVAAIARATGEPAERLRKRKERALEKLRALLSNGQGHVSRESDD